MILEETNAPPETKACAECGGPVDEPMWSPAKEAVVCQFCGDWERWIEPAA